MHKGTHDNESMRDAPRHGDAVAQTALIALAEYTRSAPKGDKIKGALVDWACEFIDRLGTPNQ